VSWNGGVHGKVPFVAGEVQIRVAHPAKQNVDLDVVRPDVAAREGELGKRLVGRCRTKSGVLGPRISSMKGVDEILTQRMDISAAR
jgi:hypothetical protein